MERKNHLQVKYGLSQVTSDPSIINSLKETNFWIAITRLWVVTLLQNYDKVKAEKQRTLAYITVGEVKVRKLNGTFGCHHKKIHCLRIVIR